MRLSVTIKDLTNRLSHEAILKDVQNALAESRPHLEVTEAWETDSGEFILFRE